MKVINLLYIACCKSCKFKEVDRILSAVNQSKHYKAIFRLHEQEISIFYKTSNIAIIRIKLLTNDDYLYRNLCGREFYNYRTCGEVYFSKQVQDIINSRIKIKKRLAEQA